MKFLDKINRRYLILLTVVLVIGSCAGYFVLRYIIVTETKESLVNKELLIKKQISESNEIPNLYPIIELKKVNYLSNKTPEFKEIEIRNELEDELEPFLEYSTSAQINGVNYSIKLRQSIFETEDLVVILAFTLLVILFVSFGILFLISKKISRTIWADFECNLVRIENYNFTKRENFQLRRSDTEEFDRLYKVIEKLTSKLESDYHLLKEFAENASHEIQTPISIALLNLDEILQQELDETTFNKVYATINSLKRLSSLNNSLILLAKIENRQFAVDQEISFHRMSKKKAEEFKPLFESKELKVDIKFSHDFCCQLNETLAERLFNNLFSNAINHNNKGGTIQIVICENEFKICNTGPEHSLTDETIFRRFTKGSSKSYGLGLAIVKNICETGNLQIQYMKNGMHCFKICKNS
ncbi:HAMP domain-containing sensor histidine kinase [Labilibaculum sp. K2S]|uniref:sensor histidine kinase n=1 Tax=Labilibaculum sp. K2S TaxID=3056386 RepID=UPI0025A3B508|nr:HAMP domain-containing sensor histidine kinase [Labilibaculum sp. K2S]MDM8160079.1 HAMP domain-containing sensor histidine kinase [Labilibaculum sp. K2S]